MSRTRRGIARLVDAAGELAGVDGATWVDRLDRDAAPVSLPPVDPELWFARFSAPPLDDVAVLWSVDAPPRLRLRLGDAGVRLLRARAPRERLLAVGRRVIDFPTKLLGEFLVPVRVEIGDEAWDVPAGEPMLPILEWLGAAPDRKVLCLGGHCGGCESGVVLPGAERERGLRLCQLPSAEGLRVPVPSPGCGWEARGSGGERSG